MSGNLGDLNVDTGALGTVGSNFSDVASEVRETYTHMKNTIDAVTENNSWRGAASDKFLEKFNNIRPTFEQHLEQLEDLGPTINATANTYADAEAENISLM